MQGNNTRNSSLEMIEIGCFNALVEDNTLQTQLQVCARIVLIISHI